MKKKLFAGLAALVVLFLIYVALIPAHYVITRSVVIQAKPEAVFPYLISMKKADEWMPWKDSDPEMKSTYKGTDSGIGAISSWESTGRMGVGQAEVVEVLENQKVKTKITYTKPMQFTQDSEFLLSNSSEGVVMTWNASGESPYINRLICALGIMNMDKYVGGEFEKGLKKLKALVETKSSGF